MKVDVRIKCKVIQTLHWTDDFRSSEERYCQIRNVTIKNNLDLGTHVFIMCTYIGVFIQV